MNDDTCSNDNCKYRTMYFNLSKAYNKNNLAKAVLLSRKTIARLEEELARCKGKQD